ncbi:DUF6161 domain-containing protein [Vibrio sp. C8]
MASLQDILPKEINNFDFSQIFDNEDSFLRFLEKEKLAWEKHSDKAKSGVCQDVASYLRKLIAACMEYKSKASHSNQDITDLRNLFKGLQRVEGENNVTKWIYSENPLVDKLIECSQNHGLYASKKFFEVVVTNSNALGTEIGEHLGLSYLIDEQQYKNTLDQKAERIEAIQERMRHREAEAEQAIETLISTSNNTITSFQDSFREHLRLEQPAQYWSLSAKKYNNTSMLWGAILSVLVLVGVMWFAYLYSQFLVGQSLGVELDTVKGIVLFLTGITVYGFLIRVVSRLLMSAVHLQRDSEERAQLTYFYLALIKDGAIDENSRNIVIQSLFCRTDTGLLAGDSSPTMPAMDVLKNIKIGGS